MSRLLLGVFLLVASVPSFGATDVWDQAVAVSERLRAEGRFTEARKTLLAESETASKSPALLAHLYNNLGSIAQDQGKFAEAERYYRLAVPQWEAVPGHLGLARSLTNLASLSYQLGELAAADRFLRRAEALQIEALGSDHPETARLVQNRAMMHLSQRQYRKAEPELRRALEIFERVSPQYEKEIAQTARGLAMVCKRAGRDKEAELYDSRARDIWERQRSGGYVNPDVLATLAKLYLDAHQPLLAEPVLEQALQMFRTQIDPEHPLAGPIFRMYAAVYQQTGRRAEAKQMDHHAKEIESNCSQACIARQTVSASDLIAGRR